jgi:hypothetical protein
MASLHLWNLYLCFMGHFSINIIVLVVVLFLEVENFLICEEDVFLPVLGGSLEPLCSRPSDLLQSRSKEVSL